MRQRSNLIILFGIAFFIVGGAIVFLVLNDEDDDGGSAASGDGTARASILVAAADIPANTLGSDAIEQGLLTTEQVDAATRPPDGVSSADALDNQIFAVNVEEGTAITNTQLTTRSLSNVPIPEGFDGVAVTIDNTPGGGGYIAPGDLVNVYGLYGTDAEDGGIATGLDVEGVRLPRTELALTNVRVLAVDQQRQTAAQAAASDDQATTTGGNQPLTYLLALRPTDAERIIHLTTYADLYLSLTAENAPPVGDTEGVAGDNVNAPVSADSAAPQS